MSARDSRSPKPLFTLPDEAWFRLRRAVTNPHCANCIHFIELSEHYSKCMKHDLRVEPDFRCGYGILARKHTP